MKEPEISRSKGFIGLIKKEENMTQNEGSNFIQKTIERVKERKFWVAFAVIFFIYLIYRWETRRVSEPKKVKEFALISDESRKTFSQSDFNPSRTVKRSQIQERSYNGGKPPQKERNYATDIAVFLYHDEQKEKKRVSLKEGKESKKIGLPAGTKIPAMVKDSIFSFNVGAPVTAVVTNDFLKDSSVLIPKESKFLGEAGVLRSLNRINVHFELLIFPDGTEHRVRALALSEDGSAGVKGRVSKHTDMKVLKAIGETTLAGVSLFAGGIQNSPYSLQDNLRMNLAQNLTSEARGNLRDVKVDTSITVEGFTPIQVILLDGI